MDALGSDWSIFNDDHGGPQPYGHDVDTYPTHVHLTCKDSSQTLLGDSIKCPY